MTTPYLEVYLGASKRPLAVVPVVGPRGTLVGQLLLDLAPYRLKGLRMDADSRPFVVNCSDGVVLVLHGDPDNRTYLRTLVGRECTKQDPLGKAWYRFDRSGLQVEEFLEKVNPAHNHLVYDPKYESRGLRRPVLPPVSGAKGRSKAVRRGAPIR